MFANRSRISMRGGEGARAAAVIGESVGIPPHLSLSPGVRLVVDSRSTPQRPGTATIDREAEMTMSSVANKESARPWQARGAAGWLALAASPTFALMAWIAANAAP